MLELPHEDVVLAALRQVATFHDVHPWVIAKSCVKRPAFMRWFRGECRALHYSSMRLLIMCLSNDHGVEFEEDRYELAGQVYINANLDCLDGYAYCYEAYCAKAKCYTKSFLRIADTLQFLASFCGLMKSR